MTFPSPTKTYHTSAYPAINPYLPSLSSEGKNVVITGGGSGIGSEITRAFAQSGAATIALLGRTENSLLKMEKEIEAEYKTTKVDAYVADITHSMALEHSLKIHAQTYGKLHYEHPSLFVLNVHPGTIKTTMSDKALAPGAVFPYDCSKCKRVSLTSTIMLEKLLQSTFQHPSWCGLPAMKPSF
jgi:short-subunit dehydrogenase involved in D-alanine esterification of teichoic acids